MIKMIIGDDDSDSSDDNSDSSDNNSDSSDDQDDVDGNIYGLLMINDGM